MRKIFFFSFLFLGAVFFSQSNIVSAEEACPGTCAALCTSSETSVSGTNCSQGNTCCVSSAGNAGVGSGAGAGASVTGTTICPANFVNKSGVCFPDATAGLGLSDVSVFDLITKVMNWLLGILGVLGVIAFVISGMQYLLSAGDENLAETAKRNMTYAIIGLAIALTGLIVVNAIAGLTGAGGGTVIY